MSTDERIHLAIIPDGNRRWAKKRLLQPWKGHETSAQNFETLLNWSREDGRIGTFTIWCFSTENWKRSPDEVEKLMEIFSAYLRDKTAELKEKNVKIIHAGRSDRFSDDLRAQLNHSIEQTKDCDGFTLQLAVDYGGKDELVRAIRRLEDEAKTDVSEEAVRACLDHPEVPDIDLIVRTSGEQRTSNFFLWQSTYAEWMFLEKHFPDVTTDDLQAAVDAYAKRQRRFGS